MEEHLHEPSSVRRVVPRECYWCCKGTASSGTLNRRRRGGFIYECIGMRTGSVCWYQGILKGLQGYRGVRQIWSPNTGLNHKTCKGVL